MLPYEPDCVSNIDLDVGLLIPLIFFRVFWWKPYKNSSWLYTIVKVYFSSIWASTVFLIILVSTRGSYEMDTFSQLMYCFILSNNFWVNCPTIFKNACPMCLDIQSVFSRYLCLFPSCSYLSSPVRITSNGLSKTACSVYMIFCSSDNATTAS